MIYCIHCTFPLLNGGQVKPFVVIRPLGHPLPLEMTISGAALGDNDWTITLEN
jgi:hypothetical protein